MNFGTITDTTATVTSTVQSSESADLQALVTASLTALGSNVVASIVLAGGGDGQAFVVLIESAPAADVDGGVIASALAVRCYQAGTAEELGVAQEGAGNPVYTNPSPPPSTIAFILSDVQVAGSSKGTMFMGMSVYVLANTVLSAGKALSVDTISGSLAAATANSMVLTSVTNNKFSIVGTKALKYDGDQAIQAMIDVDLAVQLTAADAFPATVTVALVRDVLGTPVVLASQRVDIALVNYVEDVGITFSAPLEPTALSAILDRIGILITTPAGGVGSVLSGQLRVFPL